ncbi:SDR family NAD(P)-dependent oxidoreductase [Sphingobium sp. LMA1-1-1.1]|uniref:SDR family NAD(P)-dependent oxidoreductase n=1 Tax=Sphingobium sp. LMA1-1-1.1 TaxID=3135238 RepID=UPI003430E3E5
MLPRIAVVTGAFGILGEAVCAALLANGDRVARVDYAQPRAALAGCVDFGGVDLADVDCANQTIDAIVETMGPPDILINVAGGFTWETLADSTMESWSRMFSMNAMTCLNMTKAALPQLRNRPNARIINIGSMSATSAAAGMATYAASKTAVHKITEALAAELADTSCTVNAVLPNVIDTPTNRADMPDADFSKFVQPAAIADLILFLASPASRGISGALIPVSRGGTE